MQRNTQQDTFQEIEQQYTEENTAEAKCLNPSNQDNDFEIITDTRNIYEHEIDLHINEWDTYNDEIDYRYSDDDTDISDEECENSEGEHVKNSTVSSNINSINDFLNIHSDKIINKLELNESEQLCESISLVFKRMVASWSVNCGITHSALSKLLHSIRSELPILSLPLSAVTLLGTPKHADVINIAGGEYCHFGVKKCVEKIIKKRLLNKNYDTNINLIISTDGAPLGKSSEKNLWPILCSEKSSKDVYIIGIYSGQFKPTNSNDFLEMFTQESITIINDGIIFENISYSVRIYALICDTPAKAFVLCIKYHSGYSSCTKCTIEGKMLKCICFPGKIQTLRTDEKFRNNEYFDDNYQKENTILNSIPHFGLVSNVPLDPMHLLYLGVTRKLFLIWLVSSSVHKLPQNSQNGISECLVSLKKYITYDFARKPRALKFLKLFKATEFRQLLLYTGVIILRNFVNDNVYVNFLTLHVATTILSNPVLCEKKDYVDYAEKLLIKFVNDFEILYGAEYVTHNVHNLLHLTNDARKYGILEEFSAFTFENFIACIKRMIRKGAQPLQQLLRRCIEIENLQDIDLIESSQDQYQTDHQHFNGPVINNQQNIRQYTFLKFKSFKINCKDDINNFLEVKNTCVIKALNIIRTENSDIFVVGKEMKIMGSIYTTPCISSELGINMSLGR